MSKKLVKYADVYICDPEKQPDCKGRDNHEWCGVQCFCTKDIEKAKQPVQKLTYKQMQKEYISRNKLKKLNVVFADCE